MTGLVRIPWQVCAQTASRLSIVDHVSGTRRQWVPHQEQVQIWQALEAHDWVMVAKARRIGATTAVVLYDVLWTSLQDHLGSNVACGIVLQGDDETKKRVALASDMCGQLRAMGGADFTSTTERVVFRRAGAEIESITAGGKAVGRSSGYQRLHHSEVPYWPSETTYSSLMPTLSLGGSVTVETTFDINQPNGRQAKELWQAENRYHKLFFPMSSHADYRAPAGDIDDEKWSELHKLGWKDREAASWFWTIAVRDLCAGDLMRALREYPETVEHMFSSSAGRYIQSTPKVVPCVSRIVTTGVHGDTYVTEVFLPREKTEGVVHIGVDTATGKDRDASAVSVVDPKTGALAAAFADTRIQIDDLALVVRDIVAAYRVPPEMWGFHEMAPAKTPRPIVEDNGIGEATVQALNRLGVGCARLTTTEDSKADGLLQVRRAIESGAFYGPQRLADEADDLHIDAHGRFAGKKDLLMSSGFALRERRTSPWKDPKEELAKKDPSRVWVQERIRRLQSQPWR